MVAAASKTVLEAFPLAWPVGWKRENGKESSKFSMSGSVAEKHLRDEVGRLGGDALIVSTNVPLRQDGKMRQDREPVDPGCAVYFTRNGKQMVFACDRYDLLRDNVHSIAKTIEALRGIERWGASSMMERAFSGFKELPQNAGDGEDPWAVLGIPPMSKPEQIHAAHRALAKTAHIDVGGNDAQMTRINMARDKALAAVKA